MITARPWRDWGCIVGVFVILLTEYASSQAVQDSRCYLVSGGAVENFLISEDAAVGSVIGVLSVHGDPHETLGNIALSLKEKDSPVMIAPGSKNVTLIKPLDREAVTGPSSIYVNVRCDRKRTTDPSFIIPVSVRVTDVNDNAPVWQDAPYRVRLSELTAVGSRILQNVRATDADQHGPHATVEYRVMPGPNSEYFGFVNQLDSMLVVKSPLDYETLSNFTITLRAQDQGDPPRHNDTELHVEVLDADDQNPKFLDDHYSAVLADSVTAGMELMISPHPISAVDQDVGINAPLFYTLTGDNKDLFTIDKETGQLFISEELAGSGIDAPITLVIKATQYDNADRYALATLTVSKRSVGGTPVRFAQKSYSSSVLENLPVGSVIMTLTTNQRRERTQLQYYVSDRSFLLKFAINSAGEVVLRKSLDYETDDNYQYQVMVTDGLANDTASINITVLNVNDWEPRFRYPQYEFFVSSDPASGAPGAGPPGAESTRLFVGKVEVADGDKGDYVKLSLRGQDANLFYINDMGEIYMREDAVPMLNSSVVHVVAMAVDSGTPPRQTSVPVIVHMSDDLMAAAGLATAKAGGMVIIIVFAALLSLLAVVILVLIAYIYRAKRPKSSGRGGKASGFVEHEKLPRADNSASNGNGASNGHFTCSMPPNQAGNLAAATGALGTASGSLLSVSAGASTILANSTSSLNVNGALGNEGDHDSRAAGLVRDCRSTRTLPSSLAGFGLSRASVTRLLTRSSQRFPYKNKTSHKVAPAPPPPPLVTASAEGPGTAAGHAGAPLALMSDHLQGAGDGGRSGVAWPSGTIPARVKKLSWDDDDQKNRLTVGEIHDATNPNVADQMNLTVYF